MLWEYNFLQGASTNQLWVNQYQAPFNANYLVPAVALGQTDPASAYAMLAPAFAKIQNDAIAFVNSFPAGQMRSSAQATIDGWKKDWPLITSNLSKWQPSAASVSAIVAAPAGSTQPTTILQDQAPGVYGPAAPSIFGGAAQGAAASYLPSPASVNVSTGAPAAADTGNTLMDWLPWIAGAAAVGFLLTSSRGRRQA